MRNKFILAIALFSALVIGANAQETYLGVQYDRVNPSVSQPNFRYDRITDSLGGVASVTAYETKSVGLTGEASAVFNQGVQSSQLYTGLGGVTLKSRHYESVQPFVKGLVGFGVMRAANTNFGVAKSEVDVAYKVSGGVDLGKGRVKYRLFEVGYLQTNFYGQRQNHLTLSTGLVF